MLRELQVAQARRIGDLAKAARTQRDSMLGTVRDEDLDTLKPEHGERNPASEPGPEMVPDLVVGEVEALREAVSSLGEPAHRELYALMRIGQGDLAVKDWDRGLSDAELLGDGVVTAAIVEDPDLHDHIAKALYEARLVG